MQRKTQDPLELVTTTDNSYPYVHSQGYLPQQPNTSQSFSPRQPFSTQQSALIDYASSRSSNIYELSTPTAQVKASFEPEIVLNDPIPGVTRAMAMLTNVGVVKLLVEVPYDNRNIEQPEPHVVPRRQMNTRTIVNVESVGNSRNNAIKGVNNAGTRFFRNNGNGIEPTGPKCYKSKKDESGILVDPEEYNLMAEVAAGEEEDDL
ncbi:hypothetical protein Tco_0732293 [Tanacetum coccineum]